MVVRFSTNIPASLGNRSGYQTFLPLKAVRKRRSDIFYLCHDKNKQQKVCVVVSDKR